MGRIKHYPKQISGMQSWRGKIIIPGDDDNEVHNVPDVTQVRTFVQNKT